MTALVTFVIQPPSTLHQLIPLFEEKGIPLDYKAFFTSNEVLMYIYSPPPGVEEVAFSGTRWGASRPIFLGQTDDTFVDVVLKYASKEETDIFKIITELLQSGPQSGQHHLVSLFRPPHPLPHDHFILVTRDMGDYLDAYDTTEFPLEHVDWAKQLCTAVAFLHKNHIAHLDIKPDNIVIDRKGILTLVDYSTARFISEEQPLISSAVGTLDWIAPEVKQCFDQQTRTAYCPFRADIWAVGKVLVAKIAKLDPEGTWPHIESVVRKVGKWLMKERPRKLRVILTKIDNFHLGLGPCNWLLGR